MQNQRLEKQIQFIIAADQVKNVLRQNYIIDNTRRENDAEHSWHLALMAIILFEYRKIKDLDLLKIIKMVIIHDLVEIEAGDSFAYSVIENMDKRQREEKAAQNIFGILPEDNKEEMLSLWHEFEALETNEAQFASTLDRLQPLIHNYKTEASGWKNYKVNKEDVIERNRSTKEIAPELWRYIEEMIEEIEKKGYFS